MKKNSKIDQKKLAQCLMVTGCILHITKEKWILPKAQGLVDKNYSVQNISKLIEVHVLSVRRIIKNL